MENRVRVNGKLASVGQEVAAGDIVLADGRPVKLQEKEIYLAVNKPRGVVVTTDTSHHDRLIGDLIHIPERVFAVGRLDKESEGLILMTNNGELSNQIQKAREFHEKEYLVTIDKPVTSELLAGLSGGVWLRELNRQTRPCKVQKTGLHELDITLTEGMNRQIRRMCEVYGCKVQRLRRIRIMNILLGDMKPGTCRELTEEEITQLKKLLSAGHTKT